MMEKSSRREAEDERRHFEENLTTLKQISFMKCVIFVLLKSSLSTVYAEKGKSMLEDEGASKEIESLWQILGQNTACRIFCQSAFDCNIPMHSSHEIFQKVVEKDENLEEMTSKLLAKMKLSEEENCFIEKIAEIHQKMDFSL